MNKKLLYLVIFCEGYIVLASELIGIRQLIAFVGSGTEVVSIIIGAVLLPMALGYHYAGIRKVENTRKILINNFLLSQLILTFGLSYVFLEIFYGLSHSIGIKNKIFFCFLYSFIFLIIPIFKLAQTVPLISNYFSRHTSRKITANILFYSTIGSFLGSILTTLIFMQYFGVNYALIFTLSNFLILILIIAKKGYYYEVFVSFSIFFIGYALNSPYMMDKINMVKTNQYSNIKISSLPKINGKILSINNSSSSLYAPDLDNRFKYIQYIEKNFLKNIKGENIHILIIGAGGFVLGLEDNTNNYDYVDIDSSLKFIAEKYILPEELGSNKNFINNSALAYLRNTNKKYDIIIVDVFSNLLSIPFEVNVIEFWKALKKCLNGNGILLANIIATPNFSDKYSVRVNNSFREVFPNYNRQVINDFDAFNKEQYLNIIYSYYNNEYSTDSTIYTINKSTYSIDK